MAKIGRNQPCPCGSGVKTKRCCGVPRGPSEDQLATAFLAEEVGRWAPLLRDRTDEELDELRQEVLRLPTTDLSLHAPLPRLLPLALERLRQAIAAKNPDAIARAIPTAFDLVDRPALRAQLARAVLALHDHEHRIDGGTTAYAVLDLAMNRGYSILVVAALYHALAVTTGTAHTPAGLLVAAG